MKKILIPCLMAFCIAAYADVHSDFEARRAQLNAPWCFEAFDRELSPELREALEFLYAYMPLPDVTDYPAEYFVQNAQLALDTRKEMPWGAIVPDREWRHFVLPVRVNNENLDGHRQIFYEQLKERVKGMSMEEAILEVNHWCHEKVTYEPSDARTHSPLASVSSGIGRCGEESTFTVAALRSIGIPARQVYTPRWAHTDDNHAWVEAWANGQWHFLGACEPEAVLDLGWFNAPASRGMLMTTRTLGKYDGPEEKLVEAAAYTDINVTSNYAPVGTGRVKVIDEANRPVEGAKVDFRLYNYGEFYPVATKMTDSSGQASIKAGLGEMIAWASKDGKYGFAKLKIDDPQLTTLTLCDQPAEQAALTFDIVPPRPSANAVAVDPQAAAACNARKAQEDSLRNAYIATFQGVARGNQAVVDQFRRMAADSARANALLASLCDKDWTDISLDVLADAMQAPQLVKADLYNKYVLPPRIELEYLTPHRAALAGMIPQCDQEAYRANPRLWAQWIADNISADQSWQPSTVRMDPESTLRLRRSNAISRDIAMVAGARAMGIPARIDLVSGKPQYFDAEGNCYDFWISNGQEDTAPQGKFVLTYDAEGYILNPEYYTHFTISKIEDGRPQLLNYDEGETWQANFSQPRTIDIGDYMLVSGQRMADGSVLAQVEFFGVDAGQSKAVPLVLRQDNAGIKVLGNFNSESLYSDMASGTEKSILSTTGRGYYALALMGLNDEPTNHAVRDISAMAQELEAAGRPMLWLFQTHEAAQEWTTKNQLPLPSTVTIGADEGGSIRHNLKEGLNLTHNSLPIVVIADTFNRVVFISEGYTIGLGRQLVETLQKLED